MNQIRTYDFNNPLEIYTCLCAPDLLLEEALTISKVNKYCFHVIATQLSILADRLRIGSTTNRIGDVLYHFCLSRLNLLPDHFEEAYPVLQQEAFPVKRPQEIVRWLLQASGADVFKIFFKPKAAGLSAFMETAKSNILGMPKKADFLYNKVPRFAARVLQSKHLAETDLSEIDLFLKENFSGGFNAIVRVVIRAHCIDCKLFDVAALLVTEQWDHAPSSEALQILTTLEKNLYKLQERSKLARCKKKCCPKKDYEFAIKHHFINLFYAGYNINYQNRDPHHPFYLLGETPLHWAARHGHIKTLRFLIQNGIDLTIRDEEGRTAMDLARIKKQTKAVEYMEGALEKTRTYPVTISELAFHALSLRQPVSADEEWEKQEEAVLALCTLY